ncbi:hypothetical protein [Microvirga alba]|uniref:Uncharacterized protein n=1 Tax=Microvirga alba TaxID=2791025 RepID=A0A931BQR5_9HYPH|nr:hypothetical protein [Microvirga alba]MBF9235752.1 hypothetical protein [Microvirga alba]
MKRPDGYKPHRFPAPTMNRAVGLNFRFPLTLSLAEKMLLERGIAASYRNNPQLGKRWDLITPPGFAVNSQGPMTSGPDQVVISIAGKTRRLRRGRGSVRVCAQSLIVVLGTTDDETLLAIIHPESAARRDSLNLIG